MDKTTLRAATYARVSTPGQAAPDKTSISEQIGEMESYCESHGYSIIHRFQDVASGVKRDRPGFLALQEAARAGAVDVVIGWKADRFSRSGSGMGDLLEATEKSKVDIATVADQFDRTYAELMASIAALERKAILQRTSQGKRGAARRGKVPGGKLPFGYGRGPSGTPVVVEEDAQAVRRLFQLYVQDGEGVPAIRRTLALEYGWKVTKGHIYNLLSSTAYVGEPLHYDRKHDAIEIPCPAIIDETTFKRAQVRKRDRLVRAPEGRPKPFYLLAGLFRCTECGQRLLARTRRDSGTTKRYYRCSAFTRQVCRQHPYINADTFEAQVWGEIVTVLRRPDVLVNRFSDTGDLASEIEVAEKDVQRWTRKGEKLFDHLMALRCTEEQYDAHKKAIDAPLQAAQERLGALRQRQGQQDNADGLLERFLNVAQKFYDSLEDMDDSEKARVLREVVAFGTVDKDNRPRYQMLVPPASPIFASTAEEENYRRTRSHTTAWT